MHVKDLAAEAERARAVGAREPRQPLDVDRVVQVSEVRERRVRQGRRGAQAPCGSEALRQVAAGVAQCRALHGIVCERRAVVGDEHVCAGGELAFEVLGVPRQPGSAAAVLRGRG